MSVLASVGLTLAVAVVSGGVLALLASHLRYRARVLEARDRVEGALRAEDAAWLLLDHLRSADSLLLGVFPLEEAVAGELRPKLRERLRAEDEVWNVEGRALWIRLDAPAEHVPAVAERLAKSLTVLAPAGGWLRMVAPPRDAAALTARFRESPGPMDSCGEWRVEPADWPRAEEETPDPASPGVDPTTGAMEASRAPRAFRAALAAHRRRNESLSVLRVDVDRLREYNRGPGGHAAGDAILREVARTLMACCRETDPVARLEEDEFLIWLPAGPVEAEKVAGRLCARVRETAVTLEGESYRCTIGVGVASFPEHGQSPRTLIESAEWAQAAAKSRGRGTLAVFEEAMRPATRTDTSLSEEQF